MSEKFSSAHISCDPIDVYLNSVEQALIAANAPRADRLQVLQDLEAQISDMLCQQPQPLTDEAVCAVIAQLEPPTQFAADYGNEKEIPSPEIRRPAGMTYNRWAMASVVGCALVLLGCLLLMLAAAADGHGPAVALAAMLLVVGLVLTPIALWKSYQQLRAEPARYLGRELVTRSAAVYVALTPIVLLVIACGVTQGVVLFPLGVAAFLYLQYVHARRLWQRISDSLPPQPGPGSAPNGNTHEASTKPSFNFSTAMSMPAV